MLPFKSFYLILETFKKVFQLFILAESEFESEDSIVSTTFKNPSEKFGSGNFGLNRLKPF